MSNQLLIAKTVWWFITADGGFSPVVSDALFPVDLVAAVAVAVEPAAVVAAVAVVAAAVAVLAVAGGAAGYSPAVVGPD